MHNKFRFLPLILLTLALFAGVVLLSPQQLPVINAKLLYVAMGGIMGMWFDIVVLAPYARPDSYLVNPDYRNAPSKFGDADNPIVSGYRLVFAAAMLRRAIVVIGAMIAIALAI